jgi:hypothetical protein
MCLAGLQEQAVNKENQAAEAAEEGCLGQQYCAYCACRRAMGGGCGGGWFGMKALSGDGTGGRELLPKGRGVFFVFLGVKMLKVWREQTGIM